MKYAVVIDHDEGGDYGVTVPGLPGCFSAGDTFEAALESAVDAIEFHLEGLSEEGLDIPSSDSLDAHMSNPDYDGGTWGFVDIDLTPYLGKTEKINVTLPSAVIRKIDESHKNRSKFLAEAALKALA